MDAPSRFPQSPFLVTGWSTRTLSLALIGILFLTLFPFRFTLHADIPANRFPLLLGGWEKQADAFDAFLNILLFMPFGFAIAEKFRERGKSWSTTLAWALASGALVSYGIEFTQLYIPMRDSGWQDVITNTSGSVAGFILFDVYGRTALGVLSASEGTLEKLMAWPRATVAIPAYFALWFAISVPLQMQTRLSNWNSDSLLVVGNDAQGQFPTAWKGHLFRLQVWDRAIQSEIARKFATSETPIDTQGLLADYDFSRPAQLADQRKFLPDLLWTGGVPRQQDRSQLTLDGRAWLVSKEPVATLVASLQRTNQFAIRVVCKPAEIEGSDGRIVGIWERSGPLELRIRQEGASLIFFFRNPLSVVRSDLVWHFPDVFKTGQTRDILFSYDGSSASLYLDGQPVNRSYHLGPGTSLIHTFRGVRTDELNGYRSIYYFLVFFPGGMLIGIAARSIRRRSPLPLSFVAFCFFVLPALVLEVVLVSVSGRAISFACVILSIVLPIGGALWINADRLLARMTTAKPRPNL
jgi:hypothetical protein